MITTRQCHILSTRDLSQAGHFRPSHIRPSQILQMAFSQMHFLDWKSFKINLPYTEGFSIGSVDDLVPRIVSL